TSTVTAAPASITADGTSTSTITIQLKDTNGNNLTTGGADVFVETSAGSLANSGEATDEGDGTYTIVLTSSTTAGTATLTAYLGTDDTGTATADDPTVDFTSDAASAATSMVAASPTSSTADGASTSTITVQLKDANS